MKIAVTVTMYHGFICKYTNLFKKKQFFVEINIFINKLTIMVIYTVYKITCLCNNKLYIGYTKDKLHNRLRGHFKKAIFSKSNHKFSNAILKYGKINFKIEALFESKNKQEALEKEIFYISHFNTVKNGYNTSIGGESGANGIKGRKLTPEHKEKLRLANLNKKVSEETKKLISKNHANFSGDKNPFYGKNHKEESKFKIKNRFYQKGENHHFYGKKTKTSFKSGKEHPKSQPIIINGVEYGSLSLAAKALGTYRQKIKELYSNQ
jgi:group I intron endonuclease